MYTIKEQVINAINSLPDSATVEDIMYRLYVIDKVQTSQEAVKNGKVISLDELRHEVQSW
jgi:hypothetical protein